MTSTQCQDENMLMGYLLLTNTLRKAIKAKGYYRHGHLIYDIDSNRKWRLCGNMTDVNWLKSIYLSTCSKEYQWLSVCNDLFDYFIKGEDSHTIFPLISINEVIDSVPAPKTTHDLKYLSNAEYKRRVELSKTLVFEGRSSGNVLDRLKPFIVYNSESKSHTLHLNTILVDPTDCHPEALAQLVKIANQQSFKVGHYQVQWNGEVFFRKTNLVSKL